MTMALITAYIKTKIGSQTTFELPQSEADLEQNLVASEISPENRDGYLYEEIKCIGNIEAAQDWLREMKPGITELNTFAGLISGLNDEQQNQYDCMMEFCKGEDVYELISIAEHFHEFDFVPEISDDAELGQWYVDNEYPGLDGVIYDNLDFSGVGANVLRDEGGKLTDAGYIANFDYIMNQVHMDAEQLRNGRSTQVAEDEAPNGIKRINARDLRTLPVNEGLVVQGCGGDLKEWVGGINNTLTEEGILFGGDKFSDVYMFEHDGLTNLLFSMDDVNLDIGKMAMWQLRSHDTFGGTWLSDYVPNRLGVDREPLEAPQETGDMQMGGME